KFIHTWLRFGEIMRGSLSTWYYFNKNMNVYAAYKFNQLDDNDYTKAAGVATDDQAAVGIVYQF
ncbi:porin, partial [Klebsiella pneumoniae]|uniref:porin n=1 Tax=Klebsiella pneumoniae TaxID=573 RepID=UPI0018C9DBA5